VGFGRPFSNSIFIRQESHDHIDHDPHIKFWSAILFACGCGETYLLGELGIRTTAAIKIALWCLTSDSEARYSHFLCVLCVSLPTTD
jgi:hypothetical protein